MSSSNNQPINVRLLFFAKTRELAGVNATPYQLRSRNIVVSDLLEKICTDFNLQLVRNHIILAVNERYCDNLQEVLHLEEEDEIALIPPISGG
ncbi:molybdopterin synthase sulfur carrier subunit [Glossina fuscipes]|uniref:Molybdopterin synthase sulfur carrier subunit n=1 Tax=Glossina fuscipes TaxID=7396 RepID=A0A9C5ZEK2_9MUSC|nr:molybdopterin synthase sulfur carrier subunit [Glossina fuscipes]